jgi:urea transport system ATP-binding protein
MTPKTLLYEQVPASSDLLYLEDVTVIFDGFKALDIERFSLEEKELRGVIGPNGAGKTTLCDVVSGKTRVTTGRVFFDRVETTAMAESSIARLGIGRKFQIPTVFDSLTVYENMELALPGHQSVVATLFKSRSSDDRDRIFSFLERVRLHESSDMPARNLSHGQRQWLEISMLIMSDPKLLLVDEPAAGLTDEETMRTAEILLELQGQHSIIVIEHDMDFVRQLDARVTVLNEGKIMSEGSMEEVQSDPKVIEAYIGR